MESHAPEWTVWNARQQARVWEWLALSVDVDPRYLGVSHFLALRPSESGIDWRRKGDPEWLQEMARRYRSLVSSAETQGQAVSLEEEMSATQFLPWIVAKKCRLPEALRDRARQIDAPAAAAPPRKTKRAPKAKSAPGKKGASKSSAAAGKKKKG
jgi:hypothetical protein